MKLELTLWKLLRYNGKPKVHMAWYLTSTGWKKYDLKNLKLPDKLNFIGTEDRVNSGIIFNYSYYLTTEYHQ